MSTDPPSHSRYSTDRQTTARVAATAPLGVLVVEDDVLISLVVSAVLADLGWSVTGVARSAAVAERCAAERRPELVVMDIALHGPVDGIEAARRPQALYDVPILFVTAHNDAATRARATALAPVGYLLKPFLPQRLEATLRAALGSR